jgi:hypothetical protein
MSLVPLIHLEGKSAMLRLTSHAFEEITFSGSVMSCTENRDTGQ